MSDEPWKFFADTELQKNFKWIIGFFPLKKMHLNTFANQNVGNFFFQASCFDGSFALCFRCIWGGVRLWDIGTHECWHTTDQHQQHLVRLAELQPQPITGRRTSTSYERWYSLYQCLKLNFWVVHPEYFPLYVMYLNFTCPRAGLHKIPYALYGVRMSGWFGLFFGHE